MRRIQVLSVRVQRISFGILVSLLICIILFLCNVLAGSLVTCDRNQVKLVQDRNKTVLRTEGNLMKLGLGIGALSKLLFLISASLCLSTRFSLNRLVFSDSQIMWQKTWLLIVSKVITLFSRVHLSLRLKSFSSIFKFLRRKLLPSSECPLLNQLVIVTGTR